MVWQKPEPPHKRCHEIVQEIGEPNPGNINADDPVGLTRTPID